MRVPKVSIIIPLYVLEERFFRDLKKFRKLDYPSYEIVVVSDESVDLRGFGARLLLTGKKRTGPAEKRDIALKQARGSICAFIDDDAYPHPGWLKKAVGHFSKKDIVAVGGPGVTPPEDSYWERVSGLVYESILCSGGAQYRFLPLPGRFVKDYPAYNLIVRKSVLKKVGGYGNSFYGGEDTFLCMKLIKHGKIYYDPEVLVYHHRRELFPGLMKQIANIGKHRGYFARVYPETSRRPMYFMPSLAAFGFMGLLIPAVIAPRLVVVFGLVLVACIVLVFLTVDYRYGWRARFWASVGVIMVHLVYGFNFLKGIMTSEMTR